MTQSGQPIFDAMVWSVGDVSGLEHDFAPMPDVPDPETIPSTADRVAARGEARPPFPFWNNFDGRQPNWIEDWENREPGDPSAGGWYRFLPTSTFDDPWVDACRTVILLDTMGWPATCGHHVRPAFYAPSIDLSVAFHRWRPEEPWLYVERVRVERSRRPHRVRDPGVGEGRHAARRRRESAPLPPGSAALICDHTRGAACGLRAVQRVLRTGTPRFAELRHDESRLRARSTLHRPRRGQAFSSG